MGSQSLLKRLYYSFVLDFEIQKTLSSLAYSISKMLPEVFLDLAVKLFNERSATSALNPFPCTKISTEDSSAIPTADHFCLPIFFNIQTSFLINSPREIISQQQKSSYFDPRNPAGILVKEPLEADFQSLSFLRTGELLTEILCLKFSI